MSELSFLIDTLIEEVALSEADPGDVIESYRRALLRAGRTLYFDGNPLVSRAALRQEDNPGVTFTATELGTGKYRITVDG